MEPRTCQEKLYLVFEKQMWKKKTEIKEEIVKEYQDDHFTLCTCIKLSCCVPKAYTVVYINK